MGRSRNELVPPSLDDAPAESVLEDPASAERPDAGVFARHDTFHPRFGWLKKGFDAAARDPDVFVREDSAVILGVGKNMVRAIRYWCYATGVLDDHPSGPARGGWAAPTEFGRWLLSDNGADPYLEDLASLWLLHWQLLHSGLATTWRFAFFHFAQSEFTADEFLGALEGFVDGEYPGTRAAGSSLKKDATCLLRMYGELPAGHAMNEESIHCPFAELRLLRPGSARRSYAFQLAEKPGLTSEIIAFACLQFAARRGSAARTVSLNSLARGRGSPGLGFRLSESSLYSALEDACSVEPALGLADGGGLVQLSFSSSPEQLSRTILSRHFGRAFAEIR